MNRSTFNFKLVFQLSFFISFSLLLVSCGNNNIKTESPKEVAKEYNSSTFNDEDAKQDELFIMQAAEINLEEIKMGQLAQLNSSSSKVKEMGKMMEMAHTKCYNELSDLAKEKIVTIPPDMDENGTAFYENMKSKKGNNFDSEYLEKMIQGHKKALELFETTGLKSRDEVVRQFATKTLPTLQSHLDHALSISTK